MILGINLEYDRNYTVINLQGELLKSNLKMLEEVMHHQFMKGTGVVAINIDTIDHIDPQVVLPLAQLKKYADLHNIRLVFLSENSRTTTMAKEVKLDSHFEIISKNLLEPVQTRKKRFPLDKLGLQLDAKLFQ